MRLTVFLALLCACASVPATAQVIAVEQVEKSLLFIRSEPTLTLLRESPKARAVLVFIPGGDGTIGLRPDMPFNPASVPSRSLARALAALADPARSSGSLHIVAYHSPYSLPSAPPVTSRSSRDHMVRIESVVKHYRDRFKLPVWIMGHSNGGFSIAEFLKYLQRRNNDDLLAGLIFSAGRDIADFGPTANLPALFLASPRDGCASTTPAGNEATYQRFKKGNRAATEFMWIQGAEDEASDPCTTGFHMYHGAHDEVTKAIDDFVTRHLPR